MFLKSAPWLNQSVRQTFIATFNYVYVYANWKVSAYIQIISTLLGEVKIKRKIINDPPPPHIYISVRRRKYIFW